MYARRIASTALLILVPILFGVFSPTAESSDLGCGLKCRKCNKRRLCEDAPFAPVLGSAPAMMAPVLFTTAGPTAVPPADQRGELTEYLEVIRELQQLMAEQQTRRAPNPSQATPQASPTADGDLESRLTRIQTDIQNLQRQIEQLHQISVEAIGVLDARIKKLEIE